MHTQGLLMLLLLWAGVRCRVKGVRAGVSLFDPSPNATTSRPHPPPMNQWDIHTCPFFDSDGRMQTRKDRDRPQHKESRLTLILVSPYWYNIVAIGIIIGLF